MKKKIVYVEPIDYFPKEIRKKSKLGEYSDMNVDDDEKNNETDDENKKNNEEN